MPKEFTQKRVGNSSIVEARRQQKQLAYFTQSSIQKDITIDYLVKWAERNYRSNDDFLNWVKTVFKADNFLSFYKYFRNPNAASKLVNDRIKPQLQRVFFSEDAFFKYIINGQEVPIPVELDVESFNNWMFNAILFRHNDILVTDLKDINTPFRSLISIDNVVALLSHRSVIKKIAFKASIFLDIVATTDHEDIKIGDRVGREEVHGFLFIDDKEYIFYDRTIEKALLVVPHDLGECPADYVSREPFANDDIIRKSIFSYIREQFEEYVFLKTLQKMTDPNGAFPIVTVLDAKPKRDGEDIKGETDKEPMQSRIIGGQRASFGNEVAGTESIMQAGNIIKIKPRLKEDGSIDTGAVQDFVKFHFTPVESLNYIDQRIKDIENSIITTLLGDFTEQNEAAKNELQVAGSFFNKQDRLRNVSLELSRIRQRSDFKFLALQHGPDNVSNEAFYGSDFFLESQDQLFNLFEKSPNTIERKNLLIRLTKNKNRFNRDKAEREVILYSLLPYVSDKDFDIANTKMAVDDTTFQYQTRFNYWIGLFEAEFGDILIFWEGLGDISAAEKLVLINNLIINIIEAIVSEESGPTVV